MKRLCIFLTLVLLLPTTVFGFGQSHGTARNMAGDYGYDDTKAGGDVLYYTWINAYGNGWVAIGKVRARNTDSWSLRYVNKGIDYVIASSNKEEPTHGHGNDYISITRYKAKMK